MGLNARASLRLPILLLGIALLTIPIAEVTADIISQAEALIRADRAGEAFHLLQPHEYERAGDPRFDYLFGVAALAAGQAGRASLALERTLLVQPRFAAARVDLGRAYFALGDLQRARLELEAAAAHDPPPAARATIERYLAAINTAQQHRTSTRHLTAFLEANIGLDSNVNAATTENTVFLPFFGLTATLEPDSTRQRDAYSGISAGGQLTRPLDSSTTLFGSTDIRLRRHSDREDFDNSVIGLRMGTTFGTPANNKRIVLHGQRYDRKDDSNYDLYGLQGEWHHALDANRRIQYFGQYSQVRYRTEPLRFNDFNQIVLGTSLVRQSTNRGLAVGSVYLGFEEAAENRADGDKEFAGLRGGWQWGFGRATDAYLAFGFQYANYQEENLLFATTRRDQLYDLTAGINFGLRDNWTIWSAGGKLDSVSRSQLQHEPAG